MTQPTTQLRLALDWTPNTNHTGFYVAEAKGYYAASGLEVIITTPEQDNYQLSPAKQLAEQRVELAVAPSESVLSYHSLSAAHPKLCAIATLLQEDTSAIVTLCSSQLDRPAKLDGRVYASYNARFEDAIVRLMIRQDGGQGDFKTVTPAKLGIPYTLKQGTADATWVFMGWEGIEAQRQGEQLHAFRLADYDLPYGYTPVLVAHPDSLKTRAEALQAFLAATARGYQFAAAAPDEAADILCDLAQHSSLSDRDFVRESQHYLSSHYLTPDGHWGRMAAERWQMFIDWLINERILTNLDGSPLQASDLQLEQVFSNAYLPA
ncbi:MAG: ABC transporter substrate-binding protein [Deinococcota bacterium]